MNNEHNAAFAEIAKRAAALTAQVHDELVKTSLPLEFQPSVEAAATITAAIINTNPHSFMLPGDFA